MAITNVVNTQFQRFVDFAETLHNPATSKFVVKTGDLALNDNACTPLEEYTIVAKGRDFAGNPAARQAIVKARESNLEVVAELATDMYHHKNSDIDLVGLDAQQKNNLLVTRQALNVCQAFPDASKKLETAVAKFEDIAKRAPDVSPVDFDRALAEITDSKDLAQ